jgi:FMN phosphatase YigB (HAD superfamily)
MKITAVVFDLDNTLLLDPATGEGSEEIKDRAWYRVFSEYNPNLRSLFWKTPKKESWTVMVTDRI